MEGKCVFCGLETLVESKFVRPNLWKVIRKYWYCNFCRGFTLLPSLNNQDMDDLYENYYNETPVDATYKVIKKKFTDLEKYFGSLEQSKVVLDFGCGVDGYLTALGNEYQIRVDGFEVSAKTIQILQEVFPGNSFYDKNAFEKSRETYDLIILSDVLEHLSNPRELLISLQSRLRPGGHIWIQQPLENNLTIFTFALKFWALLSKSGVSEIPPYHVSLASRRSILRLIRSTDYAVVKYRVRETLWPAQSRMDPYSIRKTFLTLLKYLDLCIACVVKNYGTRAFFLIEKKDG